MLGPVFWCIVWVFCFIFGVPVPDFGENRAASILPLAGGLIIYAEALWLQRWRQKRVAAGASVARGLPMRLVVLIGAVVVAMQIAAMASVYLHHRRGFSFAKISSLLVNFFLNFELETDRKVCCPQGI